MEMFWGFNLAAVLLLGSVLIAAVGRPRGLEEWGCWLVLAICWPFGLLCLLSYLADNGRNGEP